MNSAKIVVASSLENAIKNYKAPAKFPDYTIRHDWIQSQSSITITFYAKALISSSFQVSLTSANSLIFLTTKIDNGVRSLKIKINLKTPVKELCKCTLAATKFELHIGKSDTAQISALGDVEVELEDVVGCRVREKATDDADALYADELDEMPSLEPEERKNEFWQTVEYVDSDDSSLAGIDDLEWVETGKGDELAEDVVPKSKGGIVDDDVVEKMYKSKRKLM